MKYGYLHTLFCSLQKGEWKDNPSFLAINIVFNNPLVFDIKKEGGGDTVWAITVPLNFQRLFFKVKGLQKNERVTHLSSTFYYKEFLFCSQCKWSLVHLSHPGQLCHVSWLIRMHLPLKDILTESCHIRHLHSAWLKILSAVLN